MKTCVLNGNFSPLLSLRFATPPSQSHSQLLTASYSEKTEVPITTSPHLLTSHALLLLWKSLPCSWQRLIPSSAPSCLLRVSTIPLSLLSSPLCFSFNVHNSVICSINYNIFTRLFISLVVLITTLPPFLSFPLQQNDSKICEYSSSPVFSHSLRLLPSSLQGH